MDSRWLYGRNKGASLFCSKLSVLGQGQNMSRAWIEWKMLTLFSSLYQAICSTRLTALIHHFYPVIPSVQKKKKNPLQNYCCYLLPIIQNLISLFWHARYLPAPMPSWSISALLPILSLHCMYQASFPAIFYLAPCK